MSERPRILVLASAGQPDGDLLQHCRADCELVRVESLARGVELLRAESFDAIILGQLSLARANAEIVRRIPQAAVITTPHSAVEAIRKLTSRAN